MSEIETPELLASPDLSTPWVPLWPLSNPPPQMSCVELFDLTLGAAAPSFDVQNIPQTYTHLGLRLIARGDTAAVTLGILLRLNGDAAANYYDVFTQGSGTTQTTAEGVGTTSFQNMTAIPGASATAGLFASLDAQIQGYRLANHKLIHALSAIPWGLAAGARAVRMAAGHWAGAAAVNRITVLPASGNFVAGSRLTVYGYGPLQVVGGSSGAPGSPSYGVAFPASPVDGQEHILVDNVSNPTYQWRFRYNAGSTSPYKWEFVGGSPAYVEVQPTVAGIETTASAAFVALATAGPSFTLPREGDYLVAIGGSMWNGQAGGAARMSYDIGPTAASTDDCLTVGMPTAGFDASNHAFRERRKNGLAAGTALVSKYAAVSAGTASFRQRFLRVTPIRVA